MSEFRIEEAYCVEMGRNVTIDEANDYYFSLPENQRERLTFECPDESCREELHPGITGVNYDKDVFIMPMHFRRNAKDRHHDDCFLGLNEKILQEMLRNKEQYRKDSYRNFFLNIPDSDQIPDVFQPRREVDAVRKESATTQRQGEKRTIRRKEEIIDRFLKSKNKTRSLKAVVDAFEGLRINQRHIPSLTIEGQTMRYDIAFKHIRNMKESHTWPHIYYGSARIYRLKGGFRAFFDNTVKMYLPDKPDLEVSIFFPLDNGAVPKRHPYDALERAAKSKEHCCLYMFASKNLVNAPLGSSRDSKEWIKLETQPGETVITFNLRPCI